MIFVALGVKGKAG